MEKWRWNPDAKFVRNKQGHGILINYAFSCIKTLSKEDAKVVAGISGLTMPFELPPDVDAGLKAFLVNNLFLIKQSEFTDYNTATLQRLKAALYNSHGLIIMPTEKCNFRCTYCYESFAKGKMSDQRAEMLSKTIADMAGSAPNFSLGFFGGEPLLWPDLVLKFSSLAFRTLQKRNLPYSAGISTNGYFLTPGLFTQLIDAGVTSYQVSLDGSQEVHDQQRVTITKKPTFNTILKNLADIAATDYRFNCVIRCNIDPLQGKKAMALFERSEIDFIRKDKRFIIDIHPIWKSDRNTMLHNGDDAACSSEFTKTLDTHILYKALTDLGINNVAYMGLPSILGQGCYAGKPNWFIIGSDLAVYKCTVVFDNKKNQLGYIDEKGKLVIDWEKNELWTGSNALSDTACSSCHYRIPCGGIACPLTRFTEGTKSCPEIKSAHVLQQWANHVTPVDV